MVCTGGGSAHSRLWPRLEQPGQVRRLGVGWGGKVEAACSPARIRAPLCLLSSGSASDSLGLSELPTGSLHWPCPPTRVPSPFPLAIYCSCPLHAGGQQGAFCITCPTPGGSTCSRLSFHSNLVSTLFTPFLGSQESCIP